MSSVARAEVDAGLLITFQEVHRVLAAQLSAGRLRWFEGVSGLPLFVYWHNPAAFNHTDTPLSLCPILRCQVKDRDPPPWRCRSCCEQLWARVVNAGEKLQRFTGGCGSANCCCTVIWKHARPVTLILQARVTSAATPRRKEHGLVHATPLVFQRAVALLELFHHDLQSVVQNHVLRQEVARTLRRIGKIEADGTRLRKVLHDYIPEFPAGPIRTGQGKASERVVAAMLKYLREHYQRPMSLGELANALDMNANYLSGLFHQTTGVAFHHYLETLRLAKAEQLLLDSRLLVCDVASSVGYASPNHFRQAFKAHTGLAPNAWRDSASSSAWK